ncbi:hypothetical protein QEG73_22780 [Chitinophagaceae bacterium 26-R-25]|nr:hypothetical protein [Chitinophagaceae bacterium 26-R-25]
MYKEFLRKELLEKRYGIYSRIVEIYAAQSVELRTASCLRRWLSQELDVSKDKIELSSLDSALQRQKKKNGGTMKNKDIKEVVKNGNNKALQGDGFTFSKPGSDDIRPSRINEL